MWKPKPRQINQTKKHLPDNPRLKRQMQVSKKKKRRRVKNDMLIDINLKYNCLLKLTLVWVK